MAATVKTACLEDVSRKRLDERENTFLRRPTGYPRQRAPMPRRRRSTRMRPRGLRRNEPGEWRTRLSIRQTMSFASNPGQSRWQASLPALQLPQPFPRRELRSERWAGWESAEDPQSEAQANSLSKPECKRVKGSAKSRKNED